LSISNRLTIPGRNAFHATIGSRDFPTVSNMPLKVVNVSRIRSKASAGLLRFLIADVDHGLRRVNVASRQQRVRRFIGPAGKLLHNGLRLISRLLIARQLGEDALRLGLLQLHLLDLERRGDGVLQGERAELCHR
jgi:hypothetical protein